MAETKPAGTEGSSQQDNTPAEQEKQQPADAKDQQKGRFTVVGIGASAGGLAALQALFDALPTDAGMAFVVVTHMDPEQESLLPELLQKHTAMPVRQVRDKVAIEPDHVYVIPPNREIVITDTHLDTSEFKEPRGRRKPIDTFFRSLAAIHGDGVAIILSGSGTDGAAGVKGVKEQGGLLMVQHPDEAEYDGMPRAAIATGLADVVLPVRELAEKLFAYRRNGARLPQDADSLSAEELERIHRILTQVHARTGHDFSRYKRSTILRRIQRRMQLNGQATLDAYLLYLRHTPDEAQALFNDLLIGVTNFFRDRESWQALAEQIIPALLAGKEAGDTIRVWTIGCATGEEAYTLAILLVEHVTTLEIPPQIQIFASDLDDNSLMRARGGLYPAAIEADVSPERLKRFFVQEGEYYRVRRELRDVVLFTNHSVLRDPPFSRLDLISCRNLLIYLNRDLQQNVFEIFHYALNPEGYLFLGSSESAEMVGELFRTLDKTHRIYQARPWGGEQPQIPSLPLAMRRPIPPRAGTLPALPEPGRESVVAGLHQEALEQYGPPSVLVDEEYHILHVSETAGRYLLQPRGPMSSELLKVARPELQLELRAALFEAFEKNQAVLSQPLYVHFDGHPRQVILSVRPCPGKQNRAALERLALVLFLEDEAGEPAAEPAAPASGSGETPEATRPGVPDGHSQVVVERLRAEVQRLRERLQGAAEEYETSNEELKAANEELQSINEEYRSTAEELETSREELQSVNEELQTLNNELKNKLEEILRAHSDLENLVASTAIATLFLDRELRIQRYTPGTAELFNIRAGDHGRPIGHLTNKLAYDRLDDDAIQVLRTLVPIEREVSSQDDQWFLIRLRPYRTLDDRIDGVVITLFDITLLKEAEARLRAAMAYQKDIVDTVSEGLLVLTPDLVVQFANRAFYERFGVTTEQTVGQYIYQLGNGQWDIPALRTLLEEVLPENNAFNDFEMDHEFEGIGRRAMRLNARRVDSMQLILLALEDITERRRALEALRELNDTLEARVIERTQQVRALASRLTMAEQEERSRISQILHDDLQQRLFATQMQATFLRSAVQKGDREGALAEIGAIEKVLEGSIDMTRRLSVDLSAPLLQDEGLLEAIGWLATQMQGQFGLQVEVQAGGSLPAPDEGLRVLLLQSVRELLFNIVKHANVSRAVVTLASDDGQLRLQVVDNGQGFDVEAVLHQEQDTYGLPRLRQRLELFDGRMEIESEPGVGTRITIYAPLQRSSG